MLARSNAWKRWEVSRATFPATRRIIMSSLAADPNLECTFFDIAILCSFEGFRKKFCGLYSLRQRYRNRLITPFRIPHLSKAGGACCSLSTAINTLDPPATIAQPSHHRPYIVAPKKACKLDKHLVGAGILRSWNIGLLW